MSDPTPDLTALLAEHYTWQPVGHPGDGWACVCGEHLSPWWPKGGVRLRESALDVALRGHIAEQLTAAGFGPVRAVEAERVAYVTHLLSEAQADRDEWQDAAESAEAALAGLPERIAQALLDCRSLHWTDREHAAAHARAILAPTPDTAGGDTS